MTGRSATPLPASAYQDTLDALLRASPDAAARRLFAHVDDDFWFWLHTDGYRADPRLAALLAGMPPESVQRNFVGWAGDDALRLAFDFYRLVHRLIERRADAPVETILDFGVGWGRILRFFMRDVAADSLIGIDCLQEAVDLCHATNPHCLVELVPALPPSPLPAGRFDLVYAYSVFSHLSESAHLAWLEEFHRLLRPGGLLIVTTRDRDFIRYCAHLRTLPDLPSWAGAAHAFVDVDDCLARYDRGEFVYDPLGGGLGLDGSIFGETCIPAGYVERVWAPRYELLDYIADPQICEQNVIVARRRSEL